MTILDTEKVERAFYDFQDYLINNMARIEPEGFIFWMTKIKELHGLHSFMYKMLYNMELEILQSWEDFRLTRKQLAIYGLSLLPCSILDSQSAQTEFLKHVSEGYFQRRFLQPQRFTTSSSTHSSFP